MLIKLIPEQDKREGMPIATSQELTLDDCIGLTKAFYYDFDLNGNWVEFTKNYYIQHEDFATVQDYITFYEQNGYLFVII